MSEPEAPEGSPVALVLGGHGADALMRTVSRLSGFRVWCAVFYDEELAAVAGLVDGVLFEDAPDSSTTGPLLRLIAAAGDDLRSASSVVLIRAGTRIGRDGPARALRAIERGASVVLPARSRRHSLMSRIRLRTHPRSNLVAPSGVAVSSVAFGTLVAEGWLAAGKLLRVKDVTKLVGRPVVRRITRTPERPRGRGLPPGAAPRPVQTVTVVIPAHNEEAWMGHTLRSIFAQTRLPDEVIVVDDGSRDNTGAIARHLGARVIRPAKRQGRKAGAVNVGLREVRTEAVVIVDADTVLHPRAIEHLIDDLSKGYDATGGAVHPIDEKSLWARGRSLQYALAARFFKPLQRDFRSILVISGCISCYRTERLRAIGGLPDRTLGEDLDATWELYRDGGTVGYTSKAIAYTTEPPDFQFYRSQIRRWAAGLFQGMNVHRLGLRRRPQLLMYVLAVLWDLVTAPIAILAVPLAVALGRVDTLWLMFAGAMNLFVLGIGFRDRGVWRTLRCYPAFTMMLAVDLYFYLEVLVRELVLRRRSVVWERGRA